MSLKIATYNLFEGAKDCYNRLIDFVKAQEFDVLCLQEINGWQNDDFARLKDFSDRAGFINYVYGNSNSEYKLATLSDIPINYQTNHQEGFWHCAVEIRVDFAGQELTIVSLSLDPFKEEPRLREINKLLNKLDLAKPTIIMGSFNSLSRLDGYGPEYFDELIKAGITKYGQEKLDFKVTDKLAEAGFVDAAAKFQHFEPTTPTAYAAGEPEPPTRTDYIFVTKDLVGRVADFEVIKSEATDKLSDHYPLILTLDENTSREEPANQPAEEARREERLPSNDEAPSAENAVVSSDENAAEADETEGPKIITNEDATEGEIDLH